MIEDEAWGEKHGSGVLAASLTVAGGDPIAPARKLWNKVSAAVMDEPRLSRRTLARLGVLLAGSPLLARSISAAAPPANGQAADPAAPQPFSFERLIERTQQLAKQPYQPPREVPAWLAQLPLDQHRQIRFKKDQAVWADSPSYQIQLYFPGAVYRTPVRVNTVDAGQARPVPLLPDMFDLGSVQLGGPLPPDLGFAGLRVHYPLHQPGVFDELLMFRGGSYFRAVGRGTRYGASARGLTLNTGLGRPEEFPMFRELWVQRPSQPFDPLTIYALLDSPSVAGAYRFDVVAREHTQIDVNANLFFRADVEQVGLASLASMFFFGPNDRQGVDDFRSAVHDSGGLLIWTGKGDVLWRPLVNPTGLRLSVFADENPRGFGLAQRTRSFDSYEDLEARYDIRPNLWVEPRGTWGKGSVRLIEIPTPGEMHDNIVAFWTPEAPVTAGQELRFSYSLKWSLEPALDTGIARVVDTRTGAVAEPAGARRFVVDFDPPAGGTVPAGAPVEPVVEAGNGKVGGVALQTNPVSGGWRVSFVIEPGGNGPVELRGFLRAGDRRVSEFWLYRLDKS